MLLRRYHSLGSLPEAIVLAFLGGSVTALGYTLVIVLSRPPVLLVANAQGVARLAPAQADDAYVRSVAADFLQDWNTWTPYTYTFRRARAVSHLAAAFQAGVQAQAAQASALLASLQASASFDLTTLEIQRDPSRRERFLAHFAGRLTTYFGGVGGAADGVGGSLVLQTVTPSAHNPCCVEVVGFHLDPASAPLTTSSSAPAVPGSVPTALPPESTTVRASDTADALPEPATTSTGRTQP